MFARITLMACLLLPTGLLRADVVIVRSEPVIQRRTFDPKSPPKEMPPLGPGHTAITQSYFGSEASVSGKVVASEKNSAGNYKATVQVESIRMTVRMSVTVWTPKNAMPKIINHEEGHRKIAEHSYADAETIARQAAEAMIGQSVSATGPSPDSATDNAFKEAIRIVGQRYLDQCDVPCGKTQEIYDKITAHGTNALKEDKAVEEAISRINDQ